MILSYHYANAPFHRVANKSELSQDDSFELFKEIIHLYQHHRDEISMSKSGDLFTSNDAIEPIGDKLIQESVGDKLPNVSAQPHVFKFVPPSSAPKTKPSNYHSVGVQTSRDSKVNWCPF